MAKTQTLAGPIEQMNEKGLKIAGRWVNWSNWGCDPDPFLSDGMPVTVIATESGWIKTVETGAKEIPVNRFSPQAELPMAQPSKVTQSELIARQSMMKASCMFWQGQQVTTQIICDFADELVKHVLRGT